MVPIALGQTGTIRVAYYAGKQDRKNLGQSAHSVMLVGILVTSVTMMILLIWPEAIVEIYLNHHDPLLDEVVALALPMVLIAALFCFYNRYVDGLNTQLPDTQEYFSGLASRLATRGYVRIPEAYKQLKEQHTLKKKS